MEKAHEVLGESMAYVDDARHKLITQFADAVEAHSKGEGGDPTLRTAYEKTIAYRSVIAEKSVRTRKKREEEKKNAPSGSSSAPEATGSPGTTAASGATGERTDGS